MLAATVIGPNAMIATITWIARRAGKALHLDLQASLLGKNCCDGADVGWDASGLV
jgi:hypothetical protein